MNALDTWYAYFESSESIQAYAQWMFDYLPEALCARMPHHFATYLLVAAACLVISIAVGLHRKVEVTTALACLVLTAVFTTVSLALAIFSFYSPPQNVLWSLQGLKDSFLAMGGHLLSIDVLGFLIDVVNVLICVVSTAFWGILVILPFPPLFFAFSRERDAYGLLGGAIAFVGHSAFAFLIMLAVKTAYAISMALVFPALVAFVFVGLYVLANGY